ncbi:MAG: hypothetical protein C0501_22555 [Isosphaera sp.]|nr:hypothetical protein [Isosphaera sp.]
MADAAAQRDSLPYRPVPLAELERAASESPAALPYLLAVKFNYDVKQGGFAQLMYNLRGEFLAGIEDMLLAAGAAVAHDHYVRAVTACLEDKPGYFRFLASDYAEANAVKHALQLLSVEYLQRRADFADEAAAFLASCPRA